MVDDASCHWSCYASTHASIFWHRYRDMTPHRWWGHDLDLLGSRDVVGADLSELLFKPQLLETAAD